ncbi:MAG TPA: hypothetical protein VJP77_05495 [Planctomycetota bacterium]|nr:hypothetical protein [Planctomycetota bacterium]
MSTPHYHVLCILPGNNEITRVVSSRADADAIAKEFGGYVRQCYNPFHLPAPAKPETRGYAVDFLCKNTRCVAYLDEYVVRCQIVRGPGGRPEVEPVGRDSCPYCGRTGEVVQSDADLLALEREGRAS